MSILSKLLLLLSFIILFFNGSPLGYILFQERLGSLFGTTLFIFTSLLGALLASIAEDQSTEGKYYFKLLLISNIVIAFYPIYLPATSKYVFPSF